MARKASGQLYHVVGRGGDSALGEAHVRFTTSSQKCPQCVIAQLSYAGLIDDGPFSFGESENGSRLLIF